MCPVSGLPLRSKSEWTDVKCGDKLTVTMRVVGESILWGQALGYGDLQSVKDSTGLARRVAAEVFPREQLYVQIDDYTRLKGVSLDARRYFIDHMKKRARLLGLIFCGVTPMLKFSIRLGRRFNLVKYDVQIAKDYAEAVQLAQKMLPDDKTRPPKSPIHADSKPAEVTVPKSTLTLPDWSIQTTDFSAQLHIIDDDIFHWVSIGFFNETDVASIFEINEKAINARNRPATPIYFLLGVAGITGSTRKARKRYIEHIKRWQADHPFEMFICYGANRILSAAVNLARPFVSFAVRMVKNLDEALKLIENQKSSIESVSPSSDPLVETDKPLEADQVPNYVEELVRYLGGIDWETDGLEKGIINPDHPFRQVFDGIALIKEELDELLQERRENERALRESEEKYRSILASMEDGYYEADLSGNFTFGNASLYRIYGYSQDELMGMNYRGCIDPASVEEVYQVFNGVFISGKPARGLDYQISRKDGAKRDIEVSVSLIKNSAMQPIGFRGVVRDVTERKLAEEEKKQLESQLAQAQKMEAIGTLAGGIAHDFNNILSAIMGYSELAGFQIPKGSEAESSLEEVLKASHRARDLVQQILAFSRQSDQKQKPVQLDSIVKEVLKLLRASLPATIQIRQTMENGSGIVNADPTQIHQVLMNLCTNAAYAMQAQGGTLEVALSQVWLDDAFVKPYPDLTSGHYAKLSVRDTGEGIPPETLKRIFEPYFTTKEKGKGTGMGLAVVHGIVKSHGGIILADSQLGKGTVLDVYFPLVQDELKERQAIKEMPAPTGQERILFVDDEQTLVDLGQKALTRLGYSVVTRTSSLEALELFKVKPDQFDLVITDMTMPQMTGHRLAQELMKIRSDIAVILCTGFSQQMSEEKARAKGIKAFALKPLVMSDFARVVRRVLDERISAT